MSARKSARAARRPSSDSTKPADKPAETLHDRVQTLREQVWDVQGIVDATAEGMSPETRPEGSQRTALKLACRLLDQLAWDLLEISECSEVQS